MHFLKAIRSTIRRNRVGLASSLAAAGSVSLSPVSFTVKPGTSYQLTVAIILPEGQTDATGTSLSEVLQIAPST